MAKIYELEIKNFRGINKFSHRFPGNFTCLVGRGDSGKTTILDAIATVLSPTWNNTFYDTDFHNGNTSDPIVIEASLINPPSVLINENKYGLYIRGLDGTGEIHDELLDGHEIVITVRLEVNKDLEPQWYVVNNRHEPVRMSAADRAKLNMFMVTDYVDRHFAWSKGNPLYAILRESNPSDGEKNDVIMEALREAKGKIDQDGFKQFDHVTERVKNISSDYGVDISNTKTTIDFRDISIKDGRVCLHDGDVPLRLKGKGSKRLISIAIQSILAQNGGIVLIDEVEQGLEPDRIKHLVRTLNKDIDGQIFITTHSSDVITELDAEDLAIIINKTGDLTVTSPDEKFQDIVRSCPEALYAKKVIVCEGKTEIGICRALDQHRKDSGREYMAAIDCVYTLGSGDSFPLRAAKVNKLNLSTCVFCDSDKDDKLNPSKAQLQGSGVAIFDCESSCSIETQVFQDLPWDGVKELVAYVVESKGIDESQLKTSVKAQYIGDFPDDYLKNDAPEIRLALSKASTVKDKEWFKRINHGEFLGSIVFKYYEQMDGKQTKSMLDNLSSWIDK